MAYRKRYLRTFYNDGQYAFRQRIKKLPEVLKPEDVHRLRLAMKKLKYDYRLLEYISSGKFDAKKQFSHYQKLFRIAGEVREDDVNSRLAEELDIQADLLTRYRHFVNRNHDTNYRYLKKSIGRIGRRNAKVVIPDNSGLNKRMNKRKFVRQIYSVIKWKCKRIRKLNLKSKNTIEIHRLRKNLKILHRAMRVYSEVNESKRLDKPAGEVKQAERQLGVIHDRAVFVSSMNDFLKKTGIASIRSKETGKVFGVRADSKSNRLPTAIIDKIGRVLEESKNFLH